MSHLTWIAWDRPLGNDNYTSRCGSTYGHAGTTVSYRTLRPCTLTGTLRPRLSTISRSLNHARSLARSPSPPRLLLLLLLVPSLSAFKLARRVSVSATGAAVSSSRGVPVSTGVGRTSATSGIAPSPRLARAKARDATIAILSSRRSVLVCVSHDFPLIPVELRWTNSAWCNYGMYIYISNENNLTPQEEIFHRMRNTSLINFAASNDNES